LRVILLVGRVTKALRLRPYREEGCSTWNGGIMANADVVFEVRTPRGFSVP
jgi:hypothetical protein